MILIIKLFYYDQKHAEWYRYLTIGAKNMSIEGNAKFPTEKLPSLKTEYVSKFNPS